MKMQIGKRIKEVFDRLPKNKSATWLASQLHCDRRNVYRLFNRDNIDIQLLGRLSIIMEHDFFKDLSDELTELDEMS